jgi:DNA-binding beta-propeller fold protein YncE
MRRVLAFSWWLISMVSIGCSSRDPGTCEKDSHCTGAQVCFEGKCVSMKERTEILKKREEDAKPKICEDKDKDGARTGNGCPKGELLDCDDTNLNVSPSSTEVCDEIDNDCDGMNNEGMRGCVQTLFGGATWGNQAENRLDIPQAVLYDSAGNFLLVTDKHHVWKVNLDGRVELFAGSSVSNYADGPGSQARFSYPQGMAKAANGGVYLADCKNNCVRLLDASGSTTTVAGVCSPLTNNAGQYADGSALDARFYCPADLASAPDGSLLIVDQGNARIRVLSSNGQVRTLAGAGPVEVVDGEGQMGFQDGPAAEARFNDPQAILVDAKGVVYVSESFNCRVREIDSVASPNARVKTLAGESDTKLGMGGYVDGTGKGAKFSYPHGMVFDANGNLLIADTGNSVIRQMTPKGQVRTLYGKAGEGKAIDGPIGKARFQTPVDLAIGPQGSLFVVDGAANRLRWIVP